MIENMEQVIRNNELKVLIDFGSYLYEEIFKVSVFNIQNIGAFD